MCSGFYFNSTDKLEWFYYPGDVSELNVTEPLGILCEEADNIVHQSCNLHLTCDDICQSIPECYNNIQANSSFCQTDGSCYGLFWLDINNNTACFNNGNDTANSSCNSTQPVVCDSSIGLVETAVVDCPFASNISANTTLAPTQAPTTPIVGTTIAPNSTNQTANIPPVINDGVCHFYQDVCGSLCEDTLECRQSGMGSYCKHWETPSTCQNFFFNDSSKASFYYYNASVDPSANISTEFPISCEDADRLVNLQCSRTMTCADLCGTLPDCVADVGIPPVCGSNNTCENIYWDNLENGTVCYFNGSNSCSNANPVMCDQVKSIIQDNVLGTCPFSTRLPASTVSPATTLQPGTTIEGATTVLPATTIVASSTAAETVTTVLPVTTVGTVTTVGVVTTVGTITTVGVETTVEAVTTAVPTVPGTMV